MSTSNNNIRLVYLLTVLLGIAVMLCIWLYFGQRINN
jgi:hypothetical protein